MSLLLLIGTAISLGLSIRLYRVARVRTRFRSLIRPTSGPSWAISPAKVKTALSEVDGRVLAAVAALASVVAFVVGGPVAGGAVFVYGVVGARWHIRRRRQHREEVSWKMAVDVVAMLAADLRAGQAVSRALAGAATFFDSSAVVGAAATTAARRLAAAVVVAQTTGAPLSDVLDRLDGHIRSAQRARLSAQAQAAGAQASALLLAVMPVLGVGMGFFMGIDPFDVLLRTPIGAACLAAAIMLQLVGLAWAARLARVEVGI